MMHLVQDQQMIQISLGRADAFKLVGVFDSEDTSSDATAPEITSWNNHRNIY